MGVSDAPKRETVYNPGITAAVKELVSRCDIYQTETQTERLYFPTRPHRTWDKVGIVSTYSCIGAIAI